MKSLWAILYLNWVMDAQMTLHCNEVLSLSLRLTEDNHINNGIEDNQNCCSTYYYAIGSSAIVSQHLPELLKS